MNMDDRKGPPNPPHPPPSLPYNVRHPDRADEGGWTLAVVHIPHPNLIIRRLHVRWLACFDRGCLQCLIEVFKQIINRLQTNGETNEIRCHTRFKLLVRRQL